MPHEVALIVDDDPDLTFLLGTALAADGYQVAIARGYLDAFAALESGELQPTVMLVDLLLTDGNGVELCTAARRILGHSVKIVAMSADPNAVAAVPQGHADLLVVKPLRLDDLLANLRE